MKSLAEELNCIREKNRKLSKLKLEWGNLPKKFLIVHKETDLEFIKIRIEELIDWLLDQCKQKILDLGLIGVYPAILQNKIAINSSKVRFFESTEPVFQDFDLVITMGGDGTVLLAAWLFQDNVPPIVPFHFGTLGFLTIFNWDTFSIRLLSVLSKDLIEEFNVLNEIVIERGASPFMSILDFYGDGEHLTTIQADGVAIATPTGSTAYSLSAGGSVVHPDVSAVLVTPICPHSLSFRPLIVPEGLELKIVVSSANRGNVWVSFDGRSRIELETEDFLIVRPSSHPVITLCRENQTSDWFHSLSKCLHWNER